MNQGRKQKFAIYVLLVLSFISFLHAARADELTAEQRRLSELLAKASPNILNTNLPRRAIPENKEFSPYLTESENAELLKLLRDPHVADKLTREQVLAAIQQHELDRELGGFQFDALKDVLNRHWPHDPVVIAFYRNALSNRGKEAIQDMFSPQPGIWDDSLLEPVIHLIERNAASPRGPNWDPNWWTVMDALNVLDRHPEAWVHNASVQFRLSGATLRIFPCLTNASQSGLKVGEQSWCNAVRMLALTHDRAMIQVLRPYLENKSPAGSGCCWMVKDLPPLRVCDVVASATRELMDEPNPFIGKVAGTGVIAYVPANASYPIWLESDRKIEELQKKMDALGIKRGAEH